MTKSDPVHFVITGGTIDSFYDGAKDTVTPNKHSIIPEVLKLIKVSPAPVFTEVAMKDSRQLKDADLAKVLETIKKSKNKKILVTHGTYTMADTARFLKAKLGKTNKTIVLTGSLIPIKGFAPSDGTFNLGYAMAKLEHLKPGVYVAMNGQIFSPEEVIKKLYSGRFGSIFGEQA